MAGQQPLKLFILVRIQTGHQMIFFIIIAAVLLFIIGFWLLLLYFYTDISVPLVSKLSYKNVLVIYPHPDDEVLSVTSLVRQLKKVGARTTLLLLTKGEKGTPNAALHEPLKKIRTAEAKHAAKIIGFNKLLHFDLGDGELTAKRKTVETLITIALEKLQPDLVVTFDQTGVYGHPDHITCSQVVTQKVLQHSNIQLWYHSLPEKVLRKIKLPEHMAQDKNFKRHRVYPTHQLPAFAVTITRIKALYAHHSQVASFQKSFPIPGIPVWFFLSAMQFEYFHQVK